MLLTKVMKIPFKVIVCWMTVHTSLSAINERKPVNKNCSIVPVNHIVYLKESVTINCKYPKGENKIKYFCRKYENLNCTNIISSYNFNKAIRQRYSLTDDEQHGVYTVVLSSLTVEDAGFYWCAIQNPDDAVICLSRHHLRVLNTEEKKVSLGVSKQVTSIKCNYPESHEDSEKYLCKGEKPSNCVELIGTNEDRFVNKSRFHLNDNKRLKHFTVFIKNLSPADSGTYWCVSGGSEDTNVTKVLFSVAEKDVKRKKAHPKTTPGKTTEGEKDNDKKAPAGLIAGILLSVTLLLVAVGGLIVYQKRPMERGGSSEPCSNDAHNTEGNNEEHHYEEVALQNQQGSTEMTVYSTACPPSDNMLLYTTVNFLKDGNTLPDDTSSSDFFSNVHGAAHPPAETALYSTVKNPGEL